MSSTIPRAAVDDGAWPHNPETVPGINYSEAFAQALSSGSDSRTETDRLTGLNKYLCPSAPAPGLLCFASCTASPISVRGFNKAAEVYFNTVHAPSDRLRAQLLATLSQGIEAGLLRYFAAAGLADAILCPSGTDAILTAALLLAAERADEATTAILPSASETGTGVPLAAVCRTFDGPGSGTNLTVRPGTAIEIPLRLADGSPRGADAVDADFAAAAKAASGRVVVFLTHGTKTGLIAPVSPPPNTDVIVDACQARIGPETVAGYLRRGWPVVVTGSKFFGGPAFSGAVLFPRARLPAERPTPRRAARVPANLGTILRWTAAMVEIDAFEPHTDGMAAVLSNWAAAIERTLGPMRALVPIGGPAPRGTGWSDLPGIFTFGVRDPIEPERLLSAAELRPLHALLARRGVLLGQPVGLGAFGGLRIAIGARDLLDDPGAHGVARLRAALEEAIAPAPCCQERSI